ncbi:hypothetical protein IFM58399_00272 [Aspergillus lentulus]|uniref:Uncharacterized protein n=1 Tax=Aspergillus lentulus TaxID=293939 RepID=A0AAN6BRF9_ASPLE|nr:uncharacterized protein IFM58399_00272 [Aspergillus lentulus]KAF4158977.1 hypothetical protein CNMCM6069_002875 [Aspergillus lentulus]KAF4169507.1 hypothetical protein CNMCM6936_007490 [Aspergillus lentulus]KAF4180140.1 hypothetical protein CNMCM8060_001888 [Aspergillus lentulus]KAF4185684.1 hypothetical protein CNMCM7927_006375 [Aspergillus lentulus]KAF4197057.1 hypothetical protein CNMCM8694_003824 [Aspergillus lentulus]
MSYTSSKTWISDIIKEVDRFVRVSKDSLVIAPESSNVPQAYCEWREHRVFINQRAQEAESQRRTLRASQRASQAKTSVQPFAGKTFKDARSSVLAMETIWLPSTSFHLERPVAPWPCSNELTSDGAMRSMSGYSRFPPLPRVPENETVHWRKRAPIKPYPFDTFGTPNLGHIEGVPDTEDEMAFFVGQALLEEINIDEF